MNLILKNDMGKIKARCSYDLCDKQGEIQELDNILEECPYCHQGGDTWEIIRSKPIISWKWLLGVLVIAAIIAFFVWPCDDRTIIVGDTDTLRATINDCDSVVWTVATGDSLVSAVAINDSMCVVKALKEGQQVVVTATLEGNPNVKDSCVYAVNPVEIVTPVVDDDSTSNDSTQVIEPKVLLSLDRTSLNIEVGKSTTLVATVQPSEFATEVIWNSNAPAIAEVSSTGVVTGKSKGIAEVSARVKDKKVKAVVTVVKGINPPPPPPCLDLGYAEYCGPTKAVNGKRVPHGLGGDLEFKGYHKIDLKKASGEFVEVNRGDRMRNCKFDNGRLVQGLIIFSNGEQRWITIGS